MNRLIYTGCIGALIHLTAFSQTPHKFTIPDASMEPTYRLNQIIELHESLKSIEVGDVAITSSIHGPYATRVLALAGDEIKFITNKGLFLRNGVSMPMTKTDELSPDGKLKRIQTVTGNRKHSVYEGEMWNQTIHAHVKIKGFEDGDFTHEPFMSKKDCRVDPKEFVCKVPKGYIFVKGDNRDIASMGFVSTAKVVGFAKQ